MQSDTITECSLVFLIGPSGSGKSVIAGALSNAQNWNVYDTDMIIEEKQQVSILKIFERFGESHFRDLEADIISKISEETKSGKKGIVATGGGLPTIDGMLELMKGLGITIYLEASLDELWNRLSMNPLELEKRPLLYRKGRAALQKMIVQREPIYRKADLIITTDSLNVDEIVEKIQLAFSANGLRFKE
ncbi:shikimate kinase [uncultured Gimesia sp.]|uniref:shikimate kinase n=1 Tax=uncultured Gimesia sp. TaxID=1678688 RepID=UPI00261DD5B8|nr:shikimate kinase [uncultured Gimesia sp.]